jgi:hypothetical protein
MLLSFLYKKKMGCKCLTRVADLYRVGVFKCQCLSWFERNPKSY